MPLRVQFHQHSLKVVESPGKWDTSPVTSPCDLIQIMFSHPSGCCGENELEESPEGETGLGIGAIGWGGGQGEERVLVRGWWLLHRPSPSRGPLDNVRG